MNRITAVFLCLFAAAASGQFPGFQKCTPLTIGRQWQAPVQLYAGAIPDAATSATIADLAVSTTGEAVAVWLSAETGRAVRLYARHYSPPVFSQGSGVWQPARSLDYSLDGLENLRLAMDDQGNAIAVWVHKSPAGNAIRASFFNRVTWNPVTLSNANAAYRGAPRVAMGGTGFGMVVWEEDAFGARQIFANRFAQSLWTGARQISRVNFLDSANSPDVGVDSAGRAVAIWQQGLVSVIYGARFTAETNWAAPAIVSSNRVDLIRPAIDPERAWGAALAVNAAGDGFVGWVQGAYPQFASIRVRRIGTARPIDSSSLTNPDFEMNGSRPSNPSSLRLSIDDSGSLGVVFLAQEFTGGVRSVFARQRSVSGAITPPLAQNPSLLESRSEDAGELSFGIDGGGSGIAAWVQTDGAVPSLFASQLVHARATTTCPEQWVWSVPALAENSAELARRARVAVYRGGNAVAIWAAGAGKTPDKVFAAVFR